MPKYNLAALGDEEFEHICQSLVQQIIGPGAKVYGMGSDGAREATFHGKAAYPSSKKQWDGSWIFQVKFHNIQQIGPKEARRCLLADLDDELSKITVKFKHQCDNFILMTNVALTPVFQKGMKDRIDNEIIPKYNHLIKNIHVWGADEICRFLDAHPNIRQTYAHLIVTGDIIARLLNLIEREKTDLDELIKLYCQGCFDHEQYAALDDAGDIEDERIKLQHLFIDLDVDSPSLPKDSQILNRFPEWLKQACETDDANEENKRTSALSFLLDDTIPGLVLIGGPGEGKSTLGQYLVQIYRSRLIGILDEIAEDIEEFKKCIPRVPFRILLREYAQWIASQKESDSLFHYLAEKVSRDSGKNINSEEIHKITKSDPTLLILDGLDEVPEKRLRTKVLDNIISFVNQVRNVLQGNLRVIATTRPYGYSEEFAPLNYLHLTLKKLSSENAALYAKRWTDAREPNPREAERIKEIFSMCLNDMVVKVLTQTPLQVTILLVIIRARGAPPKQREELFERYMDIIYQREQKKRPELLRTEPDIIYGLHKYLAYILHRRVEKDKTAALMEVAEFKKRVKDYLIHCNPLLNDHELENKSTQIIAEANQRLVLIESPQEDKVGFGLTTTREFFTAAHLVDTARDTKERDARFRAIARSSHWRNVALFFAGRVGRTRPGEAPSMVDVCREIDTERVDKYIKRGAELVLEMVDDRVLREPHNEIGAIQYGLNLFESDYVRNSDEYVSRLVSLPDEYKERIIRHWLEERLSNALPESLKLYSYIYQKLFGISDTLRDAIKKASECGSTSVKLWALKSAIKYKIKENWVIKLFDTLIDLISINEISYALSDSWMNFEIFLDLSISAKTIAAITMLPLQGRIYSEHRSMYDFSTIKDDSKFNKNKLLWEVSKLLTLFSGSKERMAEVHEDIHLSIPSMASPRIKELIKKHSNLIRNFCETYSKEKEPFINFLVNVFEFVLEPQNTEKYVDVLKKYQIIENSTLWTIANVLSFPGIISEDEEEIRKYHNALITFLERYESQEQYINDQREFNKLVNKKSDKVRKHPYKLLAWIMNIGNDSIIEGYLDDKILKELKEWLQYRGLQKNSIRLHVCSVANDLGLMDINIKLIEDQIRKKEEKICVGFTFDWYDWPDKKTEQDLLVANRFKNIITEILTNYNTLIFREDYNLEQLYWVALSANIIEENEMLTLYKIFRENPNFATRPPWGIDANIGYSFLKKMMQSRNIEVVRLAAVSLGVIIDSRSYRYEQDKKRFVIEQLISDKLWELAENKEDIWHTKYIKGMASCKLKWLQNYEKWNVSIKEATTEKLESAWCQVIETSDYYQVKDRDALLNFINNILESGEMYPKSIRIAALKRLHNLIANIETGRFNEEPLNLPLSRRTRPLFSS